MSTTTPVLGLVLYDSTTDQVVTFTTFRAVWGGTATTSNFYKIDTAIGTLQTSVTTLQNQRGAIPVAANYISSNYYEATVSTITAYTTGMTILLKLDTDSDGTVTLNISSLGTKSVTKVNSSGSVVNISAGELQAGRYYMFTYDGTQWVWVDANSADQVYHSGTYGNVVRISASSDISDSTPPSTLISETITSETEKTTPVDNDLFGLVDSEAANVFKKLKWSSIKTTLKSYFDPFYKNKSISGMEMIWNSATSISVGTGACYCENGDFINATSILTASSLSLSTSTWYHVYAYLSSGSPAIEVATTSPVAWTGTAYSKTGDTSRRYLGSVLTDSSGNIYPFFHNPMQNYAQWGSAITTAPFRVLNGGTATSTTTINVLVAVPVTAKFAKLQLSNAGTSYVFICSSTGGAYFGVPAPASGVTNRFVTDSVISSGEIYYYVSSGGLMQIDIAGYFFYR